MSDGVFGTPIDTQTLEGMPEYRGKTITRADRAKVARDMQNAGGKDTNCMTYVENLKKQYGNGVSTLCTIYNATGDDLTYILAHDWHGHIYNKPYPLVIKNGQWGGWLHVHSSSVPAGSSAAVVYRGQNNNDYQMDWLLCWSIPWLDWGGSNRVYTEIREAGHYDDVGWGYLQDKVVNAGLSGKDTYNGCTSATIIGSGTTATFNGLLSLTGP